MHLFCSEKWGNWKYLKLTRLAQWMMMLVNRVAQFKGIQLFPSMQLSLFKPSLPQQLFSQTHSAVAGNHSDKIIHSWIDCKHDCVFLMHLWSCWIPKLTFSYRKGKISNSAFQHWLKVLVLCPLVSNLEFLSFLLPTACLCQFKPNCLDLFLMLLATSSVSVMCASLNILTTSFWMLCYWPSPGIYPKIIQPACLWGFWFGSVSKNSWYVCCDYRAQLGGNKNQLTQLQILIPFLSVEDKLQMAILR